MDDGLLVDDGVDDDCEDSTVDDESFMSDGVDDACHPPSSTFTLLKIMTSAFAYIVEERGEGCRERVEEFEIYTILYPVD